MRVGDSVLVNAAAFTAARLPDRELIPCEVLEVENHRVLVRTNQPYRVFAIWVSRDWVGLTGRVTSTPSRISNDTRASAAGSTALK